MPCRYCFKVGHNITTCDVFKLKKQNVSKNSYIVNDGNFKQVDNEGCCAAGIFPYCYTYETVQFVEKRTKFVLLAIEKRNRRFLCNFLGGKRDTSIETPAMIGRREFIEETTNTKGKNILLEKNKFTTDSLNKHGLWSANSKYALLAFEIQESEIDTDLLNSSSEFKEILRLQWFSIQELQLMIRNKSVNKCHQFTLKMLSEIDKRIGLDNFC